MNHPDVVIPVDGKRSACRCTEALRCTHRPLPPFETDTEAWRQFCRTVVSRIEEARRAE